MDTEACHPHLPFTEKLCWRRCRKLLAVLLQNRCHLANHHVGRIGARWRRCRGLYTTRRIASHSNFCGPRRKTAGLREVMRRSMADFHLLHRAHRFFSRAFFVRLNSVKRSIVFFQNFLHGSLVFRRYGCSRNQNVIFVDLNWVGSPMARRLTHAEAEYTNE
jgi:hypothetical protein